MAVNTKVAFEVERVTGQFPRTVTRIVESMKEVHTGLKTKELISRKLMQEQEIVTEGYMLYMPQGHSMFVAIDDHEQIERLGILAPAPLVDMETGEVVPDDYGLSNKEIVARKERNRPRPLGAAATAGA